MADVISLQFKDGIDLLWEFRFFDIWQFYFQSLLLCHFSVPVLTESEVCMAECMMCV